MIDGDVESLRSLDQSERAVLRNHALVRWLDINGVRFRRRRSRNLSDWHRGHFPSKLGSRLA